MPKTIYAIFSGGKDPATGKSWCPDCVTAEPVCVIISEAKA